MADPDAGGCGDSPHCGSGGPVGPKAPVVVRDRVFSYGKVPCDQPGSVCRRVPKQSCFSLILILLLAAAPAFGAFLTVNTTTDEFNNSGNCSLREAVQRINAGNDGRGCTNSSTDPYGTSDQIVVPAGQYDLTRSGGNANNSGDIDLLADVAFHGTAASSTVVNQTVSGERVFEVGNGSTGITVFFNDMSVTGGSSSSSFEGAGIHVENNSTATLVRCQVSGNTGTSSGAGGLGNDSTLTLIDSTVSGNTNASGSVGAGVDNNDGTVTLTNSTVSGNGGVGLYAFQGTATILSATFNGNGTDFFAENAGTRSIGNTILNSGCGGSGFTDAGYNRDAGNTCGLSAATSLSNTPVSLGPLTNNGGGTDTHLPNLTATPTQAAIDVIPPGSGGCGGSLDRDQRRAPRPVDGGTGVVNCDIGAVELNSIPTVAVVGRVRATQGDPGVVLHWETVSEVDTLGFHVEREDGDGESYVRVTDSLVLSPLAPQGSAYRFVDPGAGRSGTLRYRLVEVETDGDTRTHGPYEVGVGTPTEDGADESHNREDVLSGPARRNLAHLQSGEEAPVAGDPRPVSRAQRAREQAGKRSRTPRAADGEGETGDALRILVRHRGLQFVSAAGIESNLGLAPGAAAESIRTGGLRITNRGEDVAWLPAPGGGGLYFYGEPIDSPYTRDNVYRLTQGKGTIMRIAPGAAPPGPVSAEAFTDLAHIERDNFPAPPVASDPDDDYWFWAILIEGHETAGEVELELPLAGVASVDGEASVRVHLQGVTHDGHSVSVSLNGTYLGEGQWSGQVPETLDLSFDQALLVEGSNRLTVTGLGTSDNALRTLYVDAVDVQYQRRYMAVGDALEFGAEGRIVTVDGFGDRNVSVFDISEPLLPRLLSGPAVTARGAGFAVRFRAAPSGARWLSVSSGGVRKPVLRTVANTEALPEVAASWIVIAPRQLGEAARAYAAYRQGRGMDSAAVAVESIYDAYNHGIPDPAAIREFLADLYDRSGGTYPRYVVLAGDGSLDYRNLGGHADSLVPSLLATTEDGLFASDLLYGDRDGDSVPEFIVSRVPADTAAQLRAWTAKLARHEASSRGARKHIGLIADDPDSAGRFPEDTEELARQLPVTIDPWRIYMPDYTLDGARSALFARLAQGPGILNYLGHGGLDRLEARGLLTSDDVPGLAAQPRFPVLLALTCVINRFELPGFDALGEELVLSPESGAIGVLAPSGFSVNDRARRLNAALLGSIYAEAAPVRLGDAMLRALREYAEGGAEREMLRVYNLIGDGAVSID